MAREAIADFQSREGGSNSLTGQSELTVQKISYDILIYDTDSDSNPYDHMISAYACYDRYVALFELTYKDGACDDPMQLMEEFLGKCHFSHDLL